MEKFKLKYAEKSDTDFIDEMLKCSFNDDEMGIGYPRYDNIKDLEAEIEDYDSTLKEAIQIIYDKDKPIGICGFLYEEGSASGYIFGPVVKREYHNVDNLKEIIENMLENNRFDIGKIHAAPLDGNKVLNKAYEDQGFIYRNDHRVMRCNIDGNRRQEQWKVTNIDNKELLENLQIFNLLDEGFHWEGSRDDFNDLLSDDYYGACVYDDNEDVMGFVTWSIMEENTCCDLEYLVVDKKYRKRGIGEALIHHVINFATEKGRKEVELCTQVGNKAADLYRNQGFKDILVMRHLTLNEAK